MCVVCVSVLFLALLCSSPARGEVRSLKISSADILVNGKPTKLWGVRVGCAALREEYTKDLLASLDFYRGHGVNALVVCYQGSGGTTARVFSPDGKSFADTETRDRMRQIVTAANQRDMLVIVGLFFPRKMGTDSQDPRLESRDAYIEASRTAAEELKQYPNVILSIADDAGPASWSMAPMKFMPADAIACLSAAGAVAPDLPRACGGPSHAFNLAVAASDSATVILHTESGTVPPRFPQSKPAINVALFGHDSGGQSPQGVWTEFQMRRFAEAIDKYASSPRDHLCANFQGWHEGGQYLHKNHFIPGGAGTRKDPGTAWFFLMLDAKTRPAPEVPSRRLPTTGKSIFEE